jgi:hypothetical protein
VHGLYAPCMVWRGTQLREVGGVEGTGGDYICIRLD